MMIRQKNPSQKVDDRMHIPVKDKEVQRKIRQFMNQRNLTYEKFIEQHVLPALRIEEWDKPKEDYDEFCKQFLKICTLSDKRRDVNEIFQVFWPILMKIYRNEVDAMKIKDQLYAMLQDKTLCLDKAPHFFNTLQEPKERTELLVARLNSARKATP
jgi:hypothetical protein